jgi:DNA-directed RNA polymerase subunit H (RpoH/RPB5)
MTELNKEELNQQVDQLEKEDAVTPGIKTEMTSIAQEEKKTPEQVPQMSREDFVTQATQDYMGGLLQIQRIVKDMSKRSLIRALIAVLKLPEEGSKVNLQTKEERVVFGIGQRVLSARTTLIINHMQSEINKDKEKVQVKNETFKDKEMLPLPEEKENI